MPNQEELNIKLCQN